MCVHVCAVAARVARVTSKGLIHGRQGRGGGKRGSEKAAGGGKGKGGDVPRLSLTLSFCHLPFSPLHSLAPLVFLSAVCHTVLLSRFTHLPVCLPIYLLCPPFRFSFFNTLSCLLPSKSLHLASCDLSTVDEQVHHLTPVY